MLSREKEDTWLFVSAAFRRGETHFQRKGKILVPKVREKNEEEERKERERREERRGGQSSREFDSLSRDWILFLTFNFKFQSLVWNVQSSFSHFSLSLPLSSTDSEKVGKRIEEILMTISNHLLSLSPLFLLLTLTSWIQFLPLLERLPKDSISLPLQFLSCSSIVHFYGCVLSISMTDRWLPIQSVILNWYLITW